MVRNREGQTLSHSKASKILLLFAILGFIDPFGLLREVDHSLLGEGGPDDQTGRCSINSN